ncbi:hypothetical protein F5878DRAFT_157982 [Lentinula raphanica]|uniref:Uncharacterized protein n=1 Tax=Lentinula raphanica TaxID=153919 RepID=A0AA38P9V1_9AGAR|nr:hypothetical protein F5878DRAFT_157982 [Lentinula raphanica]
MFCYESSRNLAGSISKRTDPNQRLPPLEPEVYENLGPPPDPWRLQSLHSSNTLSENVQNQQHPAKPPCLEPPVETGPDPQPWGKSRPTNARVVEENQQQPSQDVPPQAVGPVVSGPGYVGGRFFRRVQGHKKGASVDAKMKFIKQILRDHSEDSYPCALVEHLLAPLEKSQKSHKKFKENQVLLLNEYYILAQLVKTDELEKQTEYFKTTQEYIDSRDKARRKYDRSLLRVKTKRPKAGDMIKVGLADEDGVGFINSGAYIEVSVC